MEPRRARDGVDGVLIWEMNVDKGGDGLHGTALLGMFDKVSLTRLIFGIPIEYVKLGVVGSLRGRLGGPGRGG